MKTKTYTNPIGSRAMCRVILFTLLSALISAGEGEVSLAPPTGLSVVQVAYGDSESRTLVATWANAELYDVIEVRVGGETVGAVFGTEHSAEISGLDLGVQTFELVAYAGAEMSGSTTVEFDVLDSSPVEVPVTNLECEFIGLEGGRFGLSWELGSSFWQAGAAIVSTLVEPIHFEAGTTMLEIEGVGLEPADLRLWFVNDAGYYSDPIVPDCSRRVPTFVRGDCNDDGRVSISDAIFELSHLFRGGQRWYCDDACDVNDDGDTNLSDPVSTLNHLFLGTFSGDLLTFGSCVVDETEDYLGGVCGCP